MKWKCNKVLKTVIYRVYSTAIIFFLVLCLTDIETATKISLLEMVVKMISYYIFEKIYSKYENDKNSI